MTQTNLETLQILGTIALNAVFPPSFLLTNPADETFLIFEQYNLASLTPAFAFQVFSNTISNVLSSVWFWLLYNLLTPLILIVFVILFIGAQYYLIKGYIWLFSKVFKIFSETYKTLFTEERKEKVKRFYTD